MAFATGFPSLTPPSRVLARSIIISAVVVGRRGLARNDRAGHLPVSNLRSGKRGGGRRTAVLSRPNPVDDETLVYCTCGSPSERQRRAPFSHPSLLASVGCSLWCPRICFSLRRRGPNRSRKSCAAHETRLRNEIPLRKEDKKKKKTWLGPQRFSSPAGFAVFESARFYSCFFFQNFCVS